MPKTAAPNSAFLDGLAISDDLRDALARRPAVQGPLVKICGLSTPHTLGAALDAGADLVGFVFFQKSPRHLSLEAARQLCILAGSRAIRVALTVDADDEALDAIMQEVGPDMLQLHGHEPPERVAEVRSRFGVPVLKAIGVSGAADFAQVSDYAPVADRILFDAKPPVGADLPGGNGLAFDWDLLRDLEPRLPYMLSGGLDVLNVVEAVARTGAAAVDVSSGVESSPGQKDTSKIAAFIRALRAAAPNRDRLGS